MRGEIQNKTWIIQKGGKPQGEKYGHHAGGHPTQTFFGGEKETKTKSQTSSKKKEEGRNGIGSLHDEKHAPRSAGVQGRETSCQDSRKGKEW